MISSSMNLNLKILLILYLAAMHCRADGRTYVNIINHSIQYIQNNLREREVMILKTSREVSFAQTVFLQKFSSTLLSVVVNLTELYDVPSDIRFPGLSELLLRGPESKFLEVMAIDLKEGTNITENLEQYLNFTFHFTGISKRAKCIIFVFNEGVQVDFYRLFRHMWSYKFLDIVLVEIIDETNVHHALHASNNLSGVIVHQYNPFNDDYTETDFFSPKMKLFPDKLKDLYGYKLNTGYYGRHPFIRSSGKNHSDLSISTYGAESLIVQSLAKAMNFSAVNRTPGGAIELLDYLFNNSIDFSASTFRARSRRTLRSTLIHSYSERLVFRQYPKQKIDRPNNSITIASIFVAIVVIFSIIARCLNFDSEIWTIGNITYVLMGNSFSTGLKSTIERIFFLCLIYVYITFSSDLVNMLTQINFHENHYAKLESLDDAVNHHQKFCIPKIFRQAYNASYHNPPIEDLAEDMDVDCSRCISKMLLNNTVNGCLLSDAHIRALDNLFPKYMGESIMSILHVPLVPPWNAMIFSKNSPYVNHFDGILRRLSESGLIKRWTNNDIDMGYRKLIKHSSLKELYKQRESFPTGSKVHESHMINQRWFYKNIVFLYLIACSLFSVVFLCELIFNIVTVKLSKILYLILLWLN